LIEYDINKDRSKKSEMIEKSGRQTVPFIDVEGLYITGYDPQRIKQAIEKRRSVEQ
jgi:glutaredoxin